MGDTTSSKTRLENAKSLKRELESMHAKKGANTPRTSSKTRLENAKSLKRELESMHAKMGANTPGTSSRTRQQIIDLKDQVDGLQRQVEAMKIQSAAHLAIDFNHSVSYIPEAVQKVFFGEVTTLQMQQSKTYHNMETLLRGHWSKFNSNAGYVNTEEHYAETIQAFSHWTHARTNGMIMVTDLQGIRRSDGAFLLCDPAIHSTDVLRFTRTNLGEKGFELFYNSHRCNTVCHKLKLKGSYP